MSGTDGRTTVEDLEAMLPQSDPQQDEEEQRLLKSTETAIARTEQKIKNILQTAEEYMTKDTNPLTPTAIIR